MRGTDQTRAALVSAAEALLVDEGAEGVSLRRVAQLCGVTTGAVYHHFSDKAALLGAVVDRGMARIRQAVEAVAEGDSARDTVGRRLAAYTSVVVAEGRLYQALLTTPAMKGGLGGRFPEGTPLDLLTTALNRAVAAGELPAQDTTEAAQVLWMAWQGLVSRWTFSWLDLEPAVRESWREKYFAFLWRGLGGR